MSQFTLFFILEDKKIIGFHEIRQDRELENGHYWAILGHIGPVFGLFGPVFGLFGQYLTTFCRIWPVFDSIWPYSGSIWPYPGSIRPNTDQYGQIPTNTVKYSQIPTNTVKYSHTPLPGTPYPTPMALPHTPHPGTHPHAPPTMVRPVYSYRSVSCQWAVHQASFGLKTKGHMRHLVAIFGIGHKSDKIRLGSNRTFQKWLFFDTFWHFSTILTVFDTFWPNIEKMDDWVWGMGLFCHRKSVKTRSFH